VRRVEIEDSLRKKEIEGKLILLSLGMNKMNQREKTWSLGAIFCGVYKFTKWCIEHCGK